MLLSEYTEQRSPLLLIAPFWDETQVNVANDAGGAQFRVAMADALRDSAWGEHFNVLDGYFKRPLRQTDMDLRIINDALKDMPVAVVFGTLDQHEIRADVALWNILPGETPGRRVYIRGKGRMPRDLVIKDNREFKQELGRDLAHVVGQVGAIYDLFRHGLEPDVQSFSTGEEARDREIAARFKDYKDLYELYRAAAEETPAKEQDSLKIVQVPSSRVTTLAVPAALNPLRTVSTLPRIKLRFSQTRLTITKFAPDPYENLYTINDVAIDNAGNVYETDQNTFAIRKIAPAGKVSTLAGTSVKGFRDGPGSEALFDGLDGLAVDSAGNIYVADCGNNVIRKITPTRKVSTLAGAGPILPGFPNAGDSDGANANARFNKPLDVAVDSVGNVYVADFGNNKIRKITPTGDVSTLAGTGIKGFDDGPGANATFKAPWGIAVDDASNVYVADRDNNAIRKITPAGDVSTLAGTGYRGFENGPGEEAMFNAPTSVAVDAAGNVYVADIGNNVIRKIASLGTVSTLAGSGTKGLTDGPIASATFNSPRRVSIDSAGNLYVADSGNNEIRKISP